MVVYITHAYEMRYGRVNRDLFYLVHAESEEEAFDKTCNHLRLVSPFFTANHQWSVRLSVASVPKEGFRHVDEVNAYYVCEMANGEQVGEGKISFWEWQGCARAYCDREYPGKNMVISALPKIHDIIQ